MTEIGAFAKALKRDRRRIMRTDLGAGHGGKGGGQYPMTVGETARRSSRRVREGAVLHRLIQQYKPERLLELGTHLGISTLYQGTALQPGARMVSLEGDPELARLARNHLHHWDLSRVTVQEGAFADSLDQIDLAAFQPDYVFLDGDHRYEPTLRYVHKILPHMPSGSLLVMDDIYWSKGMQKAWQEVCAFPELTVTLDLFQFGIAFVNLPLEKEHVYLTM